jgi:hypothetical protein
VTASHTYTKLTLSMGTALIDFTSDTFKVMLLSAYTVGSTQDTAQFVADVKAVATETSGAGYTAGGVTLASPTFTETGHVYKFTTATNPSWATSTISAAYALFYDSSPGSDAANPVLCYWDLGGTSSTSGTTFTLAIDAGGIVTFTGS